MNENTFELIVVSLGMLSIICFGFLITGTGMDWYVIIWVAHLISLAFKYGYNWN